MSDKLAEFFTTGRKLVSDTKQPKPAHKKKQSATQDIAAFEGDPHKVFIKRTISERPKKLEIIKDIVRFIKAAEAEL